MKKIITICLITITFVLTGCSNREYNVTCTKDFTTKISKEEIKYSAKIEIKDNEIHFSILKEDKRTKSLWGLMRTLTFNMIEGVTKGFEKRLEINGVGFKARVEGKDLFLDVGYSHPVKVDSEEGIEFKVEKNIIIVSGIDKELVGQIAAKVRRVKKPEPYKGKGIKYVDEIIKRKLGKKAAGG